MQRELSVIVHDRVSRVRSSLKTDDDVGFTGKHIRDLTLSFVSPVCSNNRFYHFYLFSCRHRRHPNHEKLHIGAISRMKTAVFIRLSCRISSIAKS